MSWFEDVGDWFVDAFNSTGDAISGMMEDVSLEDVLSFASAGAAGAAAGATTAGGLYFLSTKIEDDKDKKKKDLRQEKIDAFNRGIDYKYSVEIRELEEKILFKKFKRYDKKGKRVWMDDEEFKKWKQEEIVRRKEKLEEIKAKILRRKQKEKDEFMAEIFKTTQDQDPQKEVEESWLRKYGPYIVIGLSLLAGGAAIGTKACKNSK